MAEEETLLPDKSTYNKLYFTLQDIASYVCAPSSSIASYTEENRQMYKLRK